jgi:hypothetical protein
MFGFSFMGDQKWPPYYAHAILFAVVLVLLN